MRRPRRKLAHKLCVGDCLDPPQPAAHALLVDVEATKRCLAETTERTDTGKPTTKNLRAWS